MNRSKGLAGKLGIALWSAALGCTAWGQPSVGVSVALPAVEIRAESDFYEPLTPLGEWVVIGSYGRCWRPARVETGWRPYCHGNWERTDAGWYWVSDEPWAWATYHYGRWDFTDQYGWYWVPQTQWAPAWVSWHSGGGYVGWAPLLPAVRVSSGGYVGLNVTRISPRAYVFVEQRHFLEPIRPTTVVVNNTTIINKTVNITKVKVVNNVVINEGPATEVIVKASGRQIQTVPAQELRRKAEVAVVVKPRPPAATSEQKVPTPARSAAEPQGTKASPAAQPPAKAAEATVQEQPQKSAKELAKKTPPEAPRAPQTPAKVQEEARAKAQETQRTAQREVQERAKESDKKAQAAPERKPNGKPEPRLRPEQAPSEASGTNVVQKPQRKKGEGKPSSPGNPPGPSKSSP